MRVRGPKKLQELKELRVQASTYGVIARAEEQQE
jgi:hypothetical protein